MNLKEIKPKFLIVAILLLFSLFFSKSTGSVDIERMAIITAIGIDLEEDNYSITAQIAVPEEDSTSTEKKKTHLEGKGATVGEAIKSISDISGWYPQLVFCNLIVVGKDFKEENVLTVLDFFAKTLRVQDSALIVYSKGMPARELLSESSPMDNISSFAIQKILHKKDGFNKDVAEINIKDFCADYYSRTSSSYMPIITVIKQQDSSSGEQAQSGGNGGNKMGGMEASGGKTPESGGNSLFNAKTTALFKDGKLVGELTEDETAVFNLLTEGFSESTILVKDVKFGIYDKCNYLATVIKSNKKISLNADNSSLSFNAKLNIYCKISDQNSTHSETVVSKNVPLPEEVKTALEEKITENFYSLIQKIKLTNCDILKLDQLLYRYHYKYYPNYKDNLLEKMNINLSVNVSGQK